MGAPMIDIWETSVEYKIWGWNLPTSIVIVSFVYLYLELWALWRQNKLIWSEKSGETVSIIWFSYYGIYALAGIVYGFQINSLTVVGTSLLLGLSHIPIVRGLWKFKQQQGTLMVYEKIQVMLFTLMVPAVFFLPAGGKTYAYFTIGIIYGLVIQPYEMWKSKSHGVLEIRVVVLYLGSSLIWTWIGFLLHIPLYMVFSPISSVCLIIILILWFKYNKPQKNDQVSARPLLQ